MGTSRSIAAIVILALAAGAGNARAQTDQDHSAHHPGATQAAPQSSPATPMGQTGGMDGMSNHATPGGNGMQGMMGGDMQPMMQMMRERMAHEGIGGPMGMMRFDHIEGRIAFLKVELRITDAQQTQWTTFADVLRAQAGKSESTHREMMQGGPSAWPDRVTLEVKALLARLEAVTAIEGPARALYAVLSPDQQNKANELLNHPMGGM